MGISKIFEEQATQPRNREVVGDFAEFSGKANSELHWEIYGDRHTFERVLSVTALAADGHLLKFERRVAPTPDADDDLTRELGHLEVKHSVKATLGRWC